MVALAECCLACRAFFSPPFLRCGGGLLLFVARSPLACPKVLWKALPGRLRGLTGRYNDQMEKEERKTTASMIKRTQQFDVCSSAGVVVAAKTTVASCQAKVVCEICKDQRKL